MAYHGCLFSSNSQPLSSHWAGRALAHLDLSLDRSVGCLCIGGRMHPVLCLPASTKLWGSKWGPRLPRPLAGRAWCPHLGCEEPRSDSGSPSSIVPPRDCVPNSDGPALSKALKPSNSRTGFQELPLQKELPPLQRSPDSKKH